MINISIWGCVAALVVLLIPFYVMFKFRLKIMEVVLASMVRMAITMAVVCGVMYAAMAAGKLWISILLMLAMPLIGAVYAVRRSQLKMRKFLLPMASGMVVATMLFTFYELFLVLDIDSPLSVRLMLPISGILAGAMITSNAKALHAYYIGLLNHHQLYDYLVGNGASHRQAVNYFVRRALEANMVPQARYMAYTVVSVSPALVWALLMSGVDVWSAAAFCVSLAIAALAASVVSLIVALVVARKYCFDDYMTLKKDIV